MQGEIERIYANPFFSYRSIAFPLGEGDRRQTVEGFFCGIFYLMYQVSQKYPSVTCGVSSAQGTPVFDVLDQRHTAESPAVSAQHKARPAGALSGEPIFEKGRLKKEHLPQDHSRAEMLF
jgi:hypothetical protein